MPRSARSTLIGLALIVGLALALLAALLAIWAGRGGIAGASVAAMRMLRHGDTTVYDHRLYPARHLRPARVPQPFVVRPTPAPATPQAFAAPDGSRAALEDILKSTRTLAFVAIRHGAIEYEYYAPGHGPTVPSQYFSVSKSILATLVGMALDDGLIRSLDQPVTDFVAEVAGRGFAGVTLRQLIDMRSGMDYVENDNPFGLHVLMNYTPQVESLLLRLRATAGGEQPFRYKSGETALLSLALARALRQETLTDYAQRRLWGPLGMESEALWSLDRSDGFEKAWCCIAGTARDLAKLGRLYLADGRAGGARVLSAAWVSDSLPKPGADGVRPYTRGWWPASSEGSDFAAVGKDGQLLHVSRDCNTIIVRLGETLGYASWREWMPLFAELAASGCR